LYRFDARPDPAAGPTKVADLAYQASEACLFQGLVVVGERGAPTVHAYDPADLATDRGPLTLAGGTFVRACAADATRLYVALAAGSGADVIVELTAAPALAEAGRPALPTGLGAKTRLLDLAYDRRGGQFYGLFVADGEVNATALVPFTMGGAAGAPVAAPFALTNLGTFAP
ncbi:MAG TPA: hypothetical protein VGQ83_41130, partial [Polyangia bacterium]